MEKNYRAHIHNNNLIFLLLLLFFISYENKKESSDNIHNIGMEYNIICFSRAHIHDDIAHAHVHYIYMYSEYMCESEYCVYRLVFCGCALLLLFSFVFAVFRVALLLAMLSSRIRRVACVCA